MIFVLMAMSDLLDSCLHFYANPRFLCFLGIDSFWVVVGFFPSSVKLDANPWFLFLFFENIDSSAFLWGFLGCVKFDANSWFLCYFGVDAFWVCLFEGMWPLMKIMGRNCFTIWWCLKTTHQRILLFCGSMGDLVAPVLMVLYTSMVWISTLDFNSCRIRDWVMWFYNQFWNWIIARKEYNWWNDLNERQFYQTFMQIPFQFLSIASLVDFQ